ncbi:MAG: magnesium transporter [Bacteroidota bacterium]
MLIQDPKQRIELWNRLLRHNAEKKLFESFQEAPPIEVADFLVQQSSRVGLHLFSLLPKETQGMVFSHFTEDYQHHVYRKLPRRVLGGIFVHMASDERVDFYQKLSEKEQAKLLPYLPKKVKQDILELCAYPVETAGGIMSTDFATVEENMIVAEALKRLREDAPSRKMMYYLYVVDEEMQMKGILSLKDLVLEDSKTKISDILQDNYVFIEVDEDKESVARKIEKYDLVALPVLNEEKQIVGIVSYDDAMDIIRAEQTEDMERFMGIESIDQELDYLQTSSVQHFRKRVGWIVGLFIASSLSAIVMHSYENSLQSVLKSLLLYFPVINDAGGNTGSQTATVVIRALSLGNVTVKDWLRILFKELRVALLFVLCLFLLAFLKVIFFSGPWGKLLFKGSAHESLPGGLFLFAFVVSLSLSLQVIVSTAIGAGLPLFIKWRGGDPALAASPMITTCVDVTGLFIYFTIASLLLL